MTQLPDLAIPDLRVDLSSAPPHPADRAQWIRREQIEIWLRAWNFVEVTHLTRKWISELIAYRTERHRYLQLARAAKAAGKAEQAPVYVRKALTQHRVVKRLLRRVREAAEACAERKP